MRRHKKKPKQGHQFRKSQRYRREETKELKIFIKKQIYNGKDNE